MVQLLVRGESDRGIGAALGISASTAKAHVRNVLAKLALRSRWQVRDRFGRPRRVPSEGAASLRERRAGPGDPQSVAVVPGRRITLLPQLCSARQRTQGAHDGVAHVSRNLARLA